MKRKWLSLLLSLCLLSLLVLTAGAVSQLPLVVDNAGLLTYQEVQSLEEKAQALRDTYEMDVVILTVNTLRGKPARDYADDYYDSNGYGCGEAYSGILFLLAMEEREWHISTLGDAIYAFSDHDIEQLENEILPYLSSGAFYSGFSAYLEELSRYFDGYSEEGSVSLLLSLVVGCAVAGIAVFAMSLSMNTRRGKNSAGDYLKAGSYQLHTQRDYFLYSNISKVRRQQKSSSGTSVHTSSSGRSHGGRGGKF